MVVSPLSPVVPGTPCPICEDVAGLAFCYDNGAGHRVLLCPRCEVLILDSERRVEVLRDAHYYDERMESVYLSNRERMMDTARDYVAMTHRVFGSLSGRRLLDVGAGIGCFVEAASQAGAEVTALDIRESATRFVRATGHEAHTALLPDFAEEHAGRFDVVTAWNVIEHDDDPRRFVAGAFALLRPGGSFLLETPDNFHAFKRAAYWHFSVTPPKLRPVLRNLHTETGHRFGFSPRSGVRLLESVGFEHCYADSIPYDALLNLRKVLSRSSSLPRRLASAATLGVAMGAMQTAGIRNRFVVWGRRPA